MRRRGIAVPAAAEIPAPWASVLAPHDAPVPTGGPEVFAPLAVVLPDVDGRESHLHVISSGMPPLADWFAYNYAGFLLAAQGRHRELARGGGRRAVHVRGRRAGVQAAAEGHSLC